jgi:shikimate dehydrogenase
VKESYTLADLENWSQAAAGVRPPVRLAILGHPVEHSLSPPMQNAALQHCGIEMQYARFDIAPDELERALQLMGDHRFIGANVTLPHKMAAAARVDELDEFGQRIGAINTIRIAGDKLIGSNTDGPGFARAIRSEFSVDLRDLRVMVLGAGGGAGHSIAMQCAIDGCERLVLVNRTHEKAQQLASELKPYFSDVRVAGPVPRLEAVPWDEHALRFQIANSDLIVNATTLGMKRSDASPLPASLIAPHLMIYDTVYVRNRTPLLTAASEAGARGANGLSMLLHQGALAFETWFDRDAPLAAMQAALSA